MPMHRISLPVTSSQPKVIHAGIDYLIDESLFITPDPASTFLQVRSSDAGDTTQSLVIHGIVAGVKASESFTLNGVTWVDGSLDFTEVFEAMLDDTCDGIITIRDNTPSDLGVMLAGRRVISPDTFKRVGVDGNEVILPLNGGDEFVGESLGGQWKKDWDSGMSVFSARINGVVTGMLELGGGIPIPPPDDILETVSIESLYDTVLDVEAETLSSLISLYDTVLDVEAETLSITSLYNTAVV